MTCIRKQCSIYGKRFLNSEGNVKSRRGFIRKEKNIPEIVTLTQEADRSEEDDETQAMLQQLYRMINRLGQLEKSIILLYLEEKSYEDISEITGLTVTNVATKLNRIKDKLKKMNKED